MIQMLEFIAGVVVGAVVVIMWALRAAERKDEHDRTGSD